MPKANATPLQMPLPEGSPVPSLTASPTVPQAPASTPQAAGGAALPETYEAAMAELEQLVARLEAGDMPLDQLIGGYQRGSALLQYCRDKLKAVDEQIKVLDAGTLKVWKPQ